MPPGIDFLISVLCKFYVLTPPEFFMTFIKRCWVEIIWVVAGISSTTNFSWGSPALWFCGDVIARSTFLWFYGCALFDKLHRIAATEFFADYEGKQNVFRSQHRTY